MSILEGELMCPNKADSLRAGDSYPESSCHPVNFSLSVSQLVNKILEEFQAIVNYVLFGNSNSLLSSLMLFLYLVNALLCLFPHLNLFTVFFHKIETIHSNKLHIPLDLFQGFKNVV